MAATVGFAVAPHSRLQIGLSAFVLHCDSDLALINGEKNLVRDHLERCANTRTSRKSEKAPKSDKFSSSLLLILLELVSQYAK